MIEKKQRGVSVSLANEHEARLTLAKGQEFRNNWDEKNIYILPKLTRDDALKENQMSKIQRELLDGGVPEEKLSIRNLEPYNNGQANLDIQNFTAH